MTAKTQHLHTAIANRLRVSIRRKSLPRGSVLLEAPLALLFGSSRSPVKHALELLESEGVLQRLDGRGYLVGTKRSDEPIKITRATLGLSEVAPEALRLPTWRTIYDRVERELVHRSIFGQFRINELELSRHYKIGRTVAHEVLIQIQSAGIITRRNRTQWLTVPLDHKRINDLFDLRVLIEPRLCAHSTTRIPAPMLDDMRARLVAGAEAYPDVKADAMDDLERDLHSRVLEYGNNVEFLEALRRTRCILISGKHILGQDGLYPKKVDFFFDEHLQILDALRQRDSAGASRGMRSHLEQSRKRVLERLDGFREHQHLLPLSYITEG